MEENSSTLRDHYVDLHVHVGRNGKGNQVKITASRNLTFPAIIKECLERKGIDMVGIIDCACTGVLEDLKKLIGQGELLELPEGGLRHKDKVTVITGAEVEAVEESGGVSHHLCYFPYLRNLSEFSRVMRKHITNMELSSQRCGLPARELLAVVEATGGVMVPAHAFTPHKSVYGNACVRLSELFRGRHHDLVALELGLSADSELADRLSELQSFTFLSNSDAHSLEKIAREYNVMRLEQANFRELMLACKREAGRAVVANYGLDPRLGRYHRSFCVDCDLPAEGLTCPRCLRTGNDPRHFVRGVYDRMLAIGDQHPKKPSHRPPYRPQVPLHLVPGLGSRQLDRLIACFGSEMAVLHRARKEELIALVGYELASKILLARDGLLIMQEGGGGHYGRVTGAAASNEQLALF